MANVLFVCGTVQIKTKYHKNTYQNAITTTTTTTTPPPKLSIILQYMWQHKISHYIQKLDDSIILYSLPKKKIEKHCEKPSRNKKTMTTTPKYHQKNKSLKK